MCKDPAGNLRFRAGSEPERRQNQAKHVRHGTQKPAHNESERFWTDFDDDAKLFKCEIAQPSNPGLTLKKQNALEIYPWSTHEHVLESGRVRDTEVGERISNSHGQKIRK